MSKNEWKKCIAITGRMLLAYALIFVQGAWAGQEQKTKDKAGPPQKTTSQQTGDKPSSAAAVPKGQSKQTQAEESESAAEEKPSNDASHQGIKVHGHWTIEVRNPDGKLVTHREFENSLRLPSGMAALSALLGRQASVGGWNITLTGTGLGPCIAGGNPTSCQIVEPSLAGSLASSAIFNTLAPPAVDTNNRLVLSGQATAAMNDAINYVDTLVTTCLRTIAPSAPCQYVGNLEYTLTEATASSSNPSFSAPIPVQAGQTIAVTVVISFS